MTSDNPFRTTYIPVDWAQFYSLGYSEVCVVLESIFDGTHDVKEASQLYLKHVEQHGYRREKLLIEVAQLRQELNDSARSE